MQKNCSAYKPNITKGRHAQLYVTDVPAAFIPPYLSTIDWPTQLSIMKMQFYAR